MNEYSEECLMTFLKKQSQLFDEPVAETPEEAEAFLEDCMAVVVDSLDEVREYFEENGADVEAMSQDELERGVGGICTSERTVFDRRGVILGGIWVEKLNQQYERGIGYTAGSFLRIEIFRRRTLLFYFCRKPRKGKSSQNRKL